MGRKERLWMESSRKTAKQTVGDIQRLLGEYNAKSVFVEYEGGEVVSVSFELEVNGKKLPFRLPCRWEAVYKRLMKRKMRGIRRVDKVTEDAKRIAWRQTYRWVEAQLAYVDTEMVKPEEVFLSYLIMSEGKTLFEMVEERKFRLLEYKG